MTSQPLLPVETWSVPVDGFDPLAAYVELSKLLGSAQGAVSLLESLSGPQRDSRFSILPLAPALTISVFPGRVELAGSEALVAALRGHLAHAGFVVRSQTGVVELPSQAQLWTLLRTIRDAFAVRSGTRSNAFRFGFFGYFGYDTAWSIEELPRKIDRSDSVPDVVLTIPTAHASLDMATGISELVLHRCEGIFEPPDEDDVATALARSGETQAVAQVPDVQRPVSVMSTMSRDSYLESGKTCLEHIAAGDIYQVQLGHEVRIESAVEPLDVYKRLRVRNPSPYMFLTTLGSISIVGASPEMCLRIDEDKVAVRPIAGTTKRGRDEQEDNELIAAMLRNEKELSEHIMLVDLGRNDVSRVCKTRTLDVDELMVIEKYSHVSHIVSNVVGNLKDDVDAFDALAAAFPAGTMTGAPKIRAMEIIESLETTARGVYAGAIGLVDFDDYTITALGIRSTIYDGKTYRLRASAGFVADSDPESEWQESINKMAAPYWAVTGEEIADARIGD